MIVEVIPPGEKFFSIVKGGRVILISEVGLLMDIQRWRRESSELRQQRKSRPFVGWYVTWAGARLLYNGTDNSHFSRKFVTETFWSVSAIIGGTFGNFILLARSCWPFKLRFNEKNFLILVLCYLLRWLGVGSPEQGSLVDLLYACNRIYSGLVVIFFF